MAHDEPLRSEPAVMTTAEGVNVRLESTPNGDDPQRPLFRAEAWRDGEMIDASHWTAHPVKAEREVADMRRVWKAWDQLCLPVSA